MAGLFLNGCAGVVQPVVPPGLDRVAESSVVSTYLITDSITLYEGNGHLRHYETIVNYAKPLTNLQIRSARMSMVVNCLRQQHATLSQGLYSELFAMGPVRSTPPSAAQWLPIYAQSNIKPVFDRVCGMDAQTLGDFSPATAPAGSSR